MMQVVRFCGDCGGERPFEQPHGQLGECPDSPDGECPEWSCTACGAALLIGVTMLPSAPAVAAGARRRVA